MSLNYKKIFNTNRNSDLVEALMEFGALICKPKVPMCEKCFLKKNCKFNNPVKRIKKDKKIFKQENLNIFCYLTKNGKIALTKKNNLGYLNKFNLPQVKKRKEKESIKNWKLLTKYKNFISNKKLNINLYYRFSQSKPNDFNWYSIKENKDFMPTFTKKYLNKFLFYFNEKKIAIIGSGIAGLTLANFLKFNSNFEFMLYERKESLPIEKDMGFNWHQIV